MTTYSGINIQFPISQAIIDGSKTIETRTYALPEKYIGVEILLIETPGKFGNFKSRIIGSIKFSESFKYKNKKEFYEDVNLHKVDKNSIWAWKDKPKWGWLIAGVNKYKKPIELTKRPGIKFTTGIEIKLPS